MVKGKVNTLVKGKVNTLGGLAGPQTPTLLELKKSKVKGLGPWALPKPAGKAFMPSQTHPQLFCTHWVWPLLPFPYHYRGFPSVFHRKLCASFPGLLAVSLISIWGFFPTTSPHT